MSQVSIDSKKIANDGAKGWDDFHIGSVVPALSLRRPAHILIVDDNRAEARLIVEALKEAQISHKARVAYNGEEAVAYLRRAGMNCPLPDIVLLDFNLPTLGGHDVLKMIKNDPVLRAIPVVILSGSDHPEDIQASYASQANCFVQKPLDLEDLVLLLTKISEFWLGYALPLWRS